MLLLVLLFLAVFLTLGGYALKNMAIAYAGAGGWMIFGAHSYTESIATWDIYYSLFFLAMAMVILCILEPVILHKKKEGGTEEESLVGHYGWGDEEQDEEDRLADEEYKHLSAERAKIRRMLNRRNTSYKSSRYSRTGEE